MIKSLALAAIVTAAMAVAAVWVFLVPVFQSPDEDAHFDYAVSELAAGHLLTVRERPLEPAGRIRRSNPLTAYLEDATGFDVIRHSPQVKAPAGYGSPAYYAALDRGAPALAPQQLSPSLLGFGYPFAYYAATALWMAVLRALGSGAVELFFGARLLGVGLLGIGLVLGFLALREMGLRKTRALLLTAAVGLFPMTSFVASYVQPQVQAFALVSGSVYALARMRRSGSPGWPVAAGVTLGLLLVTKAQYWLVLAPPAAVGGALLSRAGRPARLAALVSPSGLFEAVQLWTTWQRTLSASVPRPSASASGYAEALAALHGGVVASLGFAVRNVSGAVFDLWVANDPAQTFWGDFGWEDAPLVIVPVAGRLLLGMVSLALLVLGLLRLASTGRRLLALTRDGRRRAAARLAAANPIVTAALLLTAVLFALQVVTGRTFRPQGRDWLPVLFGVFLFAVDLAPRALPRRLRRPTSNALLAGLLVYCLVGTPVALVEVHNRYYGHGRELTSVALAGDPSAGVARAHVDYLVPSGRNFLARLDSRVPSGGQLAIGGWATPAAAVFISVDGAPDVQAVYGDDSRGRGQTGFDAIIPVAGLGVGPHQLTLKVVAPDHMSWSEPLAPLDFEVVPAGETP